MWMDSVGRWRTRRGKKRDQTNGIDVMTKVAGQTHVQILPAAIFNFELKNTIDFLLVEMQSETQSAGIWFGTNAGFCKNKVQRR